MARQPAQPSQPTAEDPTKRRRPRGGAVGKKTTPRDEHAQWAVDLEARLTALINDATTSPRDVAVLSARLMDLKRLIGITEPETEQDTLDQLEAKRQARLAAKKGSA